MKHHRATHGGILICLVAWMLAACTPATQQPAPTPGALLTTVANTVPTSAPTSAPASTDEATTAAPTNAPLAATNAPPSVAPTNAPLDTPITPLGAERIYFQVTVEERAQLAAIAPDGSNAVMLTSGLDEVFDFAFSPDHRRIALVVKRQDTENIVVINSDGTSPRQIAGPIPPIRPQPSDISRPFIAEPTWSPDGTRVAFVVVDGIARDANEDIYLAAADGSGVTQVTNDPLPERAPVWSPDGTRIAFERGQYADTLIDDRRRVFVMPADGGAAQALTPPGSESSSAAWSPNGQELTLHMDNSCFTARADGTQLAKIAALPPIYADWHNFSFAPAPDGAQIAFVHQEGECRQEHCTYHIFVARADGSAVRQLTFGDATTDGDNLFNSSPTWSPDGTRIVFLSNRSGDDHLYVMDAAGGEARQVRDDVNTFSVLAWLVVPNPPRPTADATLPVPTGMIAVSVLPVGAATRDIFLFPADGTQPLRVSSSPADEYAPAWSPDGTQLAFISDRDGSPSLYRTNTAGTTLVRLAVGTADAPISKAAWSPDGLALAYDHTCVIETVRADGSDARVLLAPEDGQDACFSTPSYAPDGQTIIFAATVDSSRSAIFTISASGGTPTQLTDLIATPGSEQSPVFSPDGTRLAFVSAREGTPHIYVAQADGSDPQRLVTFAFEETGPTWSPDGRFIAANATMQNGASVYLFPVAQLPAEADAVQSLSRLTPNDPLFGDLTQPAWRPQ